MILFTEGIFIYIKSKFDFLLIIKFVKFDFKFFKNYFWFLVVNAGKIVTNGLLATYINFAKEKFEG